MKKTQAQLFLMRLLATFLRSWPHFYLMGLVTFLVDLIDFILSLAIASTVLTGGDTVINLSG